MRGEHPQGAWWFSERRASSDQRKIKGKRHIAIRRRAKTPIRYMSLATQRAAFLSKSTADQILVLSIRISEEARLAVYAREKAKRLDLRGEHTRDAWRVIEESRMMFPDHKKSKDTRHKSCSGKAQVMRKSGENSIGDFWWR